MFEIGAPEFIVLAIAALFIFGPDRLPEMARHAARGLRRLRTMALNARRELSRELGPEFEDLDIRDLNPRNFVRKHVLDAIDEDDLRIDREFDLRDDLRIDDKPTSKRSANGKSKATSSASASTTRSTSAASDGAAEPSGGTDTLVETSTSQNADGEGPAPVPPFDTEAT
ncbi:MAG TPA: sec-independent translocase [Actinopolymorphaceae bacterium]